MYATCNNRVGNKDVFKTEALEGQGIPDLSILLRKPVFFLVGSLLLTSMTFDSLHALE